MLDSLFEFKPRSAPRSFVSQRGITYTVTELLGKGGFGVVYKVVNERLKRDEALKQIAIKSPDSLARQIREAYFMAACSHEAIVRVYDVWHDHVHIYIAMEVMQGSARKLLERDGNNFRRYGINILGQYVKLADALELIHSRNLLHRDIKPDNVFFEIAEIVRDGQARKKVQLKLGDFGLAQPLALSDTDQRTNVVGTLAYIAPELHRTTDESRLNPPEYSQKSDVYSLALTLIHFSVGVNPLCPVRGTTEHELRYHASVEGVETLMAKNNLRWPSDFHAELCETLFRAVAVDPRQRLTTSEFRDQLHGHFQRAFHRRRLPVPQ